MRDHVGTFAATKAARPFSTLFARNSHTPQIKRKHLLLVDELMLE